MELGQAALGRDVYSVIINDQIHEILLSQLPGNLKLKRSKRADQIAQKVVKWIQWGEVFTYPFVMSGTPFQQRVYRATQKIPVGKVTTYKVLAEAVNTKAYRAVGQALGANPVPLLVPCHRVVGSDRGLTGFGSGIALKRKILEAEGVEFAGEKVEKEYMVEKL